MKYNTDDLRILDIKELITPSNLLAEFPVDEAASKTVYEARQTVRNILQGQDDRLIVVAGPCSIHDPEAAREYAEKLLKVAQAYRDQLFIIMRVYFEKPRTTVGWKGLINDPDLDNSFNINKGLRLARNLLLDISQIGLPTGTEFLDLITPQYVADLITWGAIGARTTESQSHRELASGISCPVGFKNGTKGSIQIAVDAIRSASNPHHFLSLTKEGHSAIFSTSGNPDCHVILRGGEHTNYDAASVDDASKMMEKADLRPNIMIDFSHANSRKLPERQKYVCRDVCTQLEMGDSRIIGVMIESNLIAGNQKLVNGKAETYGQSITDACIDWADTQTLIEQLAQAVENRRKK